MIIKPEREKKMIFVTVGTHEQPFNRLVKAIDELKKKRNSDGRRGYSDRF